MEWRTIEGFGRYEISSEGQVRLAFDVMMPPGGISGIQAVRFKKGHILKPITKRIGNTTRPGYLFIRDDGKRVNVLLHRLVALAFVPNPHNLPMVCHRDGDTWHNAASNLYWGNGKQNSIDRWKHGTMCYGEKAPAALLCADDVLNIRRQLREGLPKELIAAQYGVKPRTIKAIKSGQNWSWLKEEGAGAPSGEL